MKWIEGEDQLEFASGRRLYLHNGTIGLGHDGDLGYGSDGGFYMSELSEADRRELADEMVRRWQAFGRGEVATPIEIVPRPPHVGTGGGPSLIEFDCILGEAYAPGITAQLEQEHRLLTMLERLEKP